MRALPTGLLSDVESLGPGRIYLTQVESPRRKSMKEKTCVILCLTADEFVTGIYKATFVETSLLLVSSLCSGIGGALGYIRRSALVLLVL